MQLQTMMTVEHATRKDNTGESDVVVGLGRWWVKKEGVCELRFE